MQLTTENISTKTCIDFEQLLSTHFNCIKGTFAHSTAQYKIFNHRLSSSPYFKAPTTLEDQPKHWPSFITKPEKVDILEHGSFECSTTTLKPESLPIQVKNLRDGLRWHTRRGRGLPNPPKNPLISHFFAFSFRPIILPSFPVLCRLSWKRAHLNVPRLR